MLGAFKSPPLRHHQPAGRAQVSPVRPLVVANGIGLGCESLDPLQVSVYRSGSSTAEGRQSVECRNVIFNRNFRPESARVT